MIVRRKDGARAVTFEQGEITRLKKTLALLEDFVDEVPNGHLTPKAKEAIGIINALIENYQKGADK